MLRPTSFDVAERAGVSQSTVSRALRNSPGVHAETRARVSAATRELGYVVDRHASSRRLKCSERIALLTTCRPGEDRSAINPFYFTPPGDRKRDRAGTRGAVRVALSGRRTRANKKQPCGRR